MSISISIVEDNVLFRSTLVQLIRETADLLLADVFDSAEAAMNMYNNPPDIAIVDLQLPGMNGIELIRELKKQNTSIQFLICSVYDDDDRVFSALEAGAMGYLLKDSTSAEITEAIKDMYQGGSPMSPYIARKVISSFQKPAANTSNSLLTDREKEVLSLLAKGLLYKEIAVELKITYETVKKHLKNVYEKLHVQNKIEALNKFGLL